MANGDLEERILTKLRLRQLEKAEEERAIIEKVGAQAGGGPVYIPGGGNGSGIASALTAVGILVGVGGAGYYAYTKGYLSQVLGPVISGPKSVSAGGSYNYSIVGLTPGSPFEQDLILSDGSSKLLTPNQTAGPDGTARVSLPIDSSIPAGLTQLRVTDLGTGKVGKKNFTVIGTTATGDGGGGTNGLVTGLHATGDPIAIYTSQYIIHVTGATPNNQVKLEILAAGQTFSMLPYVNSDSVGAVGIEFTVSPQFGFGPIKMVVTDIGTGASTTLTTTVIPTPG